MKGNEHGTQKLLDYQAEQARQALKIATARSIVTEKIVNRYIKVKGETKTVTQFVDREVVRYANTGFCLDAEWRSLHDDSANNAIPNTGLRTNGEGGAPTAADAIKTVTANYAACHRTADRLDALQGWVKDQQQVDTLSRSADKENQPLFAHIEHRQPTIQDFQVDCHHGYHSCDELIQRMELIFSPNFSP